MPISGLVFSAGEDLSRILSACAMALFIPLDFIFIVVLPQMENPSISAVVLSPIQEGRHLALWRQPGNGKMAPIFGQYLKNL